LEKKSSERMNPIDLSVVIPLYRSEDTITDVVEELHIELAKLNISGYEIILVNDASPDGVLGIAKKLATLDSRVKLISLAKNCGQTTAMIVGYQHASGKYIVNMDDDFQNPAFEIEKLLDKLVSEDLDVVFAKYPSREQSTYRRMGSKINYKMTEYMMNKPKGIQTNAFFIMRKFISDEIIKYNNNYPYVFGIIFAATNRIGNVEITHRARLKGESGYTFRSLVSLWLNGVLNFSVKPLRIATGLGFLVSFAAFVGIIWAFISRILNPVAPLGWASTVIIILFFAGVQLASIGLLGEYIGRLYISNSNLPKAVVRERINIENIERVEGDKIANEGKEDL